MVELVLCIETVVEFLTLPELGDDLVRMETVAGELLKP